MPYIVLVFYLAHAGDCRSMHSESLSDEAGTLDNRTVIPLQDNSSAPLSDLEEKGTL